MRPRARVSEGDTTLSLSTSTERERIDLKLGVAAVTAGRKPLLQFASICVSEILDRAIARAPGGRGREDGVFPFAERLLRRRRPLHCASRLRRKTGALIAPHRQPIYGLGPAADAESNAGVPDTCRKLIFILLGPAPAEPGGSTLGVMNTDNFDPFA